MKNIVKWAVVCTVGAFLTQGALAQGQSQSGDQSKSSQSQKTFRVSKLIGQTAKDSQGQEIGKLSDVVINPQTKDIFAVLDMGNDRYAPVPWQLLQITSDQSGNQQLSLNTSKQNLQAAPTVSKGEFSNLSDPSFTEKLYSYFHAQPPSRTAMGGTGSGSSQTSGGQSGGQDQQQQEQPQQESPDQSGQQ